MQKRRCRNCDRQFQPQNPNHWFCTVRCSPSWRARRPVRTCDVCGAQWCNVRGGRRALRCSDECQAESARRRHGSRGEYERRCSLCGETFVTNQPSRRWCSDQCKDRGNHGRLGGRDRIVDASACEWCGKFFDRTAAQRNRQFCDLAHQQAHARWRTGKEWSSRVPVPKVPPPEPDPRACDWCGDPFVSGRKAQRLCSDDCRALEYKPATLVYFPECRSCGDLFATNRSHGRYCSRACMRARDRWPISPKKRQKVYDRDGGICHLCDEPVDESDCWEAPGADGRSAFIVGDRYPSIDHLVPRSMGGDHSMANLKLAHHGCNTRRGILDLEAA